MFPSHSFSLLSLHNWTFDEPRDTDTLKTDSNRRLFPCGMPCVPLVPSSQQLPFTSNNVPGHLCLPGPHFWTNVRFLRAWSEVAFLPWGRPAITIGHKSSSNLLPILGFCICSDTFFCFFPFKLYLSVLAYAKEGCDQQQTLDCLIVFPVSSLIFIRPHICPVVSAL